QRADRAERDQVARREDGVGPAAAREKLAERALGRFEAEIDAHVERGVGVEPVRLERFEIALAALHRLGIARPDESDRLSPQPREMERRAAPAEHIVRSDRAIFLPG